jgi:hypothetical protein
MLVPTAKQGVADRSGDRPELQWQRSVASIPRGQDLYLLHVLRWRMEYPKLKRGVRRQCQAVAASVVLIEDTASGTQLIQKLVAEGLHAVTARPPRTASDSNRGRCPHCEHAYRNERRRDDRRHANG